MNLSEDDVERLQNLEEGLGCRCADSWVQYRRPPELCSILNAEHGHGRHCDELGNPVFEVNEV